MKAITLLTLCFLFAGCSIWQSDGKKYLEQKAFSCSKDDDCGTATLFSQCYQSTQAPEFLTDDSLDEFSIRGDVFGFLDSKKSKFWSYTVKNTVHYFCESNTENLNKAESPQNLLVSFLQLLEDQQ